MSEKYLSQAKKLLTEYFVTRKDRICVYPEMSISIDGNLEEWIDRHIKGEKRLGFYTLNLDSTVNWAVIDLDNHSSDDEVSGYIEKYLDEFKSLSNQIGLHYNMEISKRGDFHIWVFFDEPIDARIVRTFFHQYNRLIGDKSSLPLKWICNIEIFPKQDRLQSADEFGNLVWLPFFGGTDKIGAGVQDGKTVFLDADGKESHSPTLKTIADLEEFAKLLCIDLDKPAGDIAVETISSDALGSILQNGVGEGSRNSIAFDIARKLKYKGLSMGEVSPIVSNWNKVNNPPLSEQEIHKILKSVYSNTENSDDIEMMYLEELLSDETPLPTPIIGGGLLYKKTILLLSGYRKDGKSMLSLNCGLCLATGQPWLGFEIQEPQRVVVIQAEVVHQFNKKRLNRMLNAFEHEVTPQSFAISKPFSGNIVDTKNLDKFKNVIDIYEPDVLIVDPLKYYHHSDENDNQKMHLVMSKFRELTYLGPAIILIHHSGKPSLYSNNSRTNPRGASSIADDVDSLMEISKKKNNELNVQFELRYGAEPDNMTITMDSDYWFSTNTSFDIDSQIVSMIRKAGESGILKKDVEDSLHKITGNSTKMIGNHIINLIDNHKIKTDGKKRNIRLFTE